MLDAFIRPLISRPLDSIARVVLQLKISPNLVTLGGLIIGLGCIPALAMRMYPLAGVLLCINRFLDGIDGSMARQSSSTPFGAYLDIVCDLLFYGGFVFGFALAQPENAVWAACLLFAFIGTSSSFLAYNALNTRDKDPEGRGLYFLAGLTEGTETLLFFLGMILWHHLFAVLAIVFSVLCHITTLSRFFMVSKKLNPNDP
jgi:phosphatidylglycerophosphate synthase